MHTIRTYNDFAEVAHQVANSNTGVVVEIENNQQVAIVPLQEYQTLKGQGRTAPKQLSGFVAELREKNRHRSTEEIEDTVDRAVEAVRYGTPHA
jgi:hypothetical protein